MQPLIPFRTPVIQGLGKAKELGSPTLNLALEGIPPILEQGVHAVLVDMPEGNAPAVMYYGPRLQQDGSLVCEVHLLDRIVEKAPQALTIEVVQFLRPVRSLASEADMMRQIAEDIAQARAALSSR